VKGVPGFHEPREEILEAVWTLSEQGGATVETILEIGDASETRAVIDELANEGLLTTDNGDVALTSEGETVARHVVRAHRLAARLLTDLLELPGASIESLACRLEHAISPELADSLCTLLGHPPTAPNGRPIPRGTCCQVTSSDVGALVLQLPQLDLGTRGRITFIHPRFAGRLEQLSSLGLVPGTDVHLRQQHPSVVVEVGETTLALDRDVARDIFVKPLR
jgi:DtxR family Mn-dependent transcriptional regulator